MLSNLQLSLVAALLFLVGERVTCADNTSTTEGPDESSSLKKLRMELLVNRSYDRMSRPVKNHLTQTKVDMRITINEFVELDTASSTLVTDAWFHIMWKDELLTWDPNDYQQLKSIHMNANEIWKPDIVLINTANQDNMLSLFTDSEVVVNSTGEVTWITMGLLRSKCPVWAYDYPYALRPVNCRLTFCSLIYQSYEVNITTPPNELYLAGPWFVNPRLQFLNVSGDRYERYFEGYGTYSFETLTVTLKRRDNALPLIIRVPTLVSITLVLCMFFMPVTWSVRIHMALFAILIQLLLILYIGIQLGPNAVGLARPISYLRDDLFLASLALTMTLIFRRLLALADHLPQLPYIMSTILNGPVARLLCFGVNQVEYGKFVGGSGTGGNRMNSILPTTIVPQRTHLGDHVSLVNEDFGSEIDRDTSTVSVNSVEKPIKVDLSDSQLEWMQLIIFADRVLFAFYALLMVPRII